MANKYEAHTHDGAVYDVTTEKHHGDHTEEGFKQHLGRIIDGTISGAAGGIVGGVILKKFIFKGRA